jgi:hypothetical protein
VNASADVLQRHNKPHRAERITRADVSHLNTTEIGVSAGIGTGVMNKAGNIKIEDDDSQPPGTVTSVKPARY